MDGQREHCIRKTVCHGALVHRRVEITEGRLPMHWNGIINGGRDVLCFQGLLESGPDLFVGHLNGVLRPTGIEPIRHFRGLDHAFQFFGITCSHAVDVFQLMFLESFQFDQQDCGLETVEA